jgi:hypothetical protein
MIGLKITKIGSRYVHCEVVSAPPGAPKIGERIDLPIWLFKLRHELKEGQEVSIEPIY